MASTVMSKAGLEVGCKVWRKVGRKGHAYQVLSEPAENYPMGICVELRGTGRSFMAPVAAIQRDFEDAQAARHERFARLLSIFPGDIGVPESNDTIERYCCVRTMDGAAFYWADTLPEVLKRAGALSDDWTPEGCWDLDTGKRFNLQISARGSLRLGNQVAEVQEVSRVGDPKGGTYTVTFDDQTSDPIPYDAPWQQANMIAGKVGISISPYPEPGERIADAITLNITVDPVYSDALQSALHEVVTGACGIECFTVSVDHVRQV